MPKDTPQTAALFRMVMPDHLYPYDLKSKYPAEAQVFRGRGLSRVSAAIGSRSSSWRCLGEGFVRSLSGRGQSLTLLRLEKNGQMTTRTPMWQLAE